MTRSRATALVIVATMVALGAGCADVARQLTPFCDPHLQSNSVLLETQSVPTASRVACITELPTGVRMDSIQINSDHTEFVLGSDRAGTRALVVRLDRTCDTAGATEISSEQPDTRRFERIESVTPGFRAARYYTFKGGCITYRFDLRPKGRALVQEISLAVSSVSRAVVDDELRRATGGRDHL